MRRSFSDNRLCTATTCQSLRHVPESLQIRITKASVVGFTRVVASQNNCFNGANLKSDMGAVLDTRFTARVFMSAACPPRAAATVLRMRHGSLSSTLKFYFTARVALPHHSVLHQHNQNIGSDPFASSASLSHPEERSPFDHQTNKGGGAPRWFIIKRSRHACRKSKATATTTATALTLSETYC